LMWQWIYDAKVGALNGLLVSLHLMSGYRGWLSNPTDAVLALVTAHVWNALPLAVILLLAALQAIPAELYDAGRVDGSGPWQLFRHVTAPWLAQPLLVVLILQTMLAIRVFDVIYVLTAGGPGTATTTLVWQTYLTTFDSLDFGLGNAYAYTVSLITLGLALVYFHLLYGRGEFEGGPRPRRAGGRPRSSRWGGRRWRSSSWRRFPGPSSPASWGRATPCRSRPAFRRRRRPSTTT